MIFDNPTGGLCRYSTVGRLFLSLVLYSFSISITFGQDPHFSQFFANRIYLNPAYAGFDAGQTYTINYRDQWFGLADGSGVPFNSGFRTMNASVNLQAPCVFDLQDVNLGFALSFFNDEAGDGPLRTTGFGFAFSHEQPLVGTRSGVRWLNRLDIRVGGHLSFQQKSLQDNYLLFSSNLDPVWGVIDRPATATFLSDTYANLNAGILLRGNFGRVKHAENLFTLGLSWSNINQPGISFTSGDSNVLLPIRTTVYLGSSHKITRYQGVYGPWYIAPQFRWDTQLNGSLNTQTIGAYIFEKAFYGGLFFQYNFPDTGNARAVIRPGINPTLFGNSTVLILNAGIDLRTVFDNGIPWRKRDSGMVLGLSYDLNIGGLSVGRTSGVMEVNLRVNLVNEQKRRQKCDGSLGKFEIYKGQCPTRF